MIKDKDLNRPIKDYGIDQKTISIEICREATLGQGGEGVAYQVKIIKNDQNQIKNVVCKEIKYIDEFDKERVLNFINKIYSEFMML